MLAWKKDADRWRAADGPFVIAVAPKGDGRFTWTVYADGKDAATAYGVGSSLGAAKTAAEQFVKRSGRV